MNSRCDICLEETCGGLKNCNCETCTQKDECPRVLRPTIRITTKCTQSCNHCCFECSPNENKMMNIQTAKNINEFLINNKIDSVNIMGGEFFCNPDWYKIISFLIKDLKSARLVSNGDWVENKEVKRDLMMLLIQNPILRLSLSLDKWHNNKNTEEAAEICEKYKLNYNIANKDEVTDNSIVPIGRGELEYGIYSIFQCYCTKPDRKYHFMIDEDGEIYKCPFGIWNYADVVSYKNDFRERFKEFHGVFYKSFIGNCKGCIRAHRKYEKEMIKND